MTKRRSKKNKSGSHGYGSGKHNRGAGNRGGRGDAGQGKKAKHQKQTEDGVHSLGEKGFNSRSSSQDAINLRDIDERIESFVEQGVAKELDDGGYKFEADKAGYQKVTGKGHLTKNITVVSENFSDSAQRKIEENKGEYQTK